MSSSSRIGNGRYIRHPCARNLLSHDMFSPARAPLDKFSIFQSLQTSTYRLQLIQLVRAELAQSIYLVRTVMSDDQATAPLEEMEASLVPGASTRATGEIMGRISATGDVISERQENERDPEEREQPANNVGPEQQIIEGAAAILGLNGDGGGGGSGREGGGQSKPSEGILANVIRSVIGAPFYPLRLVQVRFIQFVRGHSIIL